MPDRHRVVADLPDRARAEGEGTPTAGVELRIVDAHGATLPVGAEGEVRVKGPQLFLGYVDPALDADAFDADGFFRSGDVGYVAEEGHLVITGRLKEVIVRNGENLSIREIEDLLLQHPALADAAVLGVPDPVTGEQVCVAAVSGRAPTSTWRRCGRSARHAGSCGTSCPSSSPSSTASPATRWARSCGPSSGRSS